ncbi:MAG: lipoate--protein ligase [Firmicutes bacterium]|nr:lipoate--protein ligase [Bacillota bacterium]
MEYIVNDCLDPYFNLALEEYLFTKENNHIYFWLWQNDNTIVIGKNQNAFQEINLKPVQENKVKVARRITGGGAVYHDLGNINFTFIVPSQGAKNYDFRRFTGQIAKTLQAFGLHAEHSGRNDLLLEGKKISGNAQYVGKTKILHHGTLLFSSDATVIGKYLNPLPVKLQTHGVGSVKSRVTTILAHLPQKISITDFKNELSQRICAEYEQVNIGCLTDQEIAQVNNLRDHKFSTYEWIFGASPEFNYSKSLLFNGCGVINLSMNLSKANIIESCKISGDFFGSGDINELEKLLISHTLTKNSIMEALKDVDLQHYFSALNKEDFYRLFVSGKP